MPRVIRSDANRPGRVRLSFPEGEGRTKQSEKDATDINLLMAKYIKTGVIDHVNRHSGHYGFADSVTYHDAMNTVLLAQEMFMDLPSAVRNRFEGDPGRFLDFVSDEANRAEMAEMGLIEVPESVSAPATAEGSEEPSSPAEAEPAAPEGGPAQ